MRFISIMFLLIALIVLLGQAIKAKAAAATVSYFISDVCAPSQMLSNPVGMAGRKY